MPKPLSWLATICLLLVLGQAAPIQAQAPPNDGFQRRNGQMHVLRNGQLRPMTRDARLPSGAVVTKDGFVVSRTGQRTELREGQACDLHGNVATVVPTAGGLVLAPARGSSSGGSLQQGSPAGRGWYYKENRGRGKKRKRKKRKEWDD